MKAAQWLRDDGGERSRIQRGAGGTRGHVARHIRENYANVRPRTQDQIFLGGEDKTA